MSKIKNIRAVSSRHRRCLGVLFSAKKIVNPADVSVQGFASTARSLSRKGLAEYKKGRGMVAGYRITPLGEQWVSEYGV